MVRYLSDGWLDELTRVAADSASLAAATAELAVTIQQEVTAGPDGDVTYHVVIEHGTVSFRPGAAGDPDVTFCQDHATATSIAQGETSAQVAFMVGKMRVSGRVERLVDEVATMEQLNDVFESVRADTEF